MPLPDYATKDDIANLQRQIDALDARVSKLEGGSTAVTPSPDGTEVRDTAGQIVDSVLRCFRLVGMPSNYRVDCDGTVSGAEVVRLYAYEGECYQQNKDGAWYCLPDDALDNDAWVACDDPTGEAPPEPIKPDDDYTFRDEFNGELSLWNYQQPDDVPWQPTRWYADDNITGWSCNAGRMVNPYYQPGTASLYGVNSDGQLFLGMERHQPSHGDCSGNPFVTAQINQLSFKQRGGYWEARIKPPRIRGTNTAFWLMRSESWPPEIDVVEMVQFSDGSTCMAQNLWEMDQTTNPYYDFSATPDAWATFGFYWDLAAGRMHYFYNGKHTHEVVQPSEGYESPMFVILSMQQGGDWSGPVPDDESMGQMLVDYVRISERLPGALQSAPQAKASMVPPRDKDRPRGAGLGASVRFGRD